MLLSKNLRTALGTASLLMSLVVADSSFAAAAPKAVAKSSTNLNLNPNPNLRL